MMKLTIECLKSKYEKLLGAIDDAYAYDICEENREERIGALNELCRMILCGTTTYEGMSMIQLMMHVEADIRYISDHMSKDEEERHIHHHWDLIEQREKELQEFMKNKNNES